MRLPHCFYKQNANFPTLEQLYPKRLHLGLYCLRYSLPINIYGKGTYVYEEFIHSYLKIELLKQ